MFHPLSSRQVMRRKSSPARNKNLSGQLASYHLAASITREASRQTYYTIRYLVDRALVADAYRAYAYFRWVDDKLDQGVLTQAERLAFLHRQQEIVACCCQGERPYHLNLCPEENMVADLIAHNPTDNSGLLTYINQMMAVMMFDANRQGRCISQAELVDYTRCLATAVTEALHYFIGHNCASPKGDMRYVAVTGAHITHMLRDAIEDTAVGYYNIPQEFSDAYDLDLNDVQHAAYRTWVQQRVQLARHYFALGRTCLAQVESLRCRLAGYAYIARFEVVLDAIVKDGCQLRAAYPERKSKQAGLQIGLATLRQTLASSLPTGRRIPITDIVPSLEITK
ncbi:MAG: squalene/phytoene synthase family protein [Ardenticatenaceae bacterium]|nr:squalene/phytoene synthase family protein [Ardenticatenaceae bacterium]